MAGFPPMAVDPRRTLHEDGVPRDSVGQDLYSTVGIAGGAVLPPELTFFNYSLGQNVPGAGNAAGVLSRLWHTNMTNAGQLGRPKKFRCTGVRVHVPAIAFSASNTPALSDPSSTVAVVTNDDLIEDVQLIYWTGALRLRIGEKQYADHPLIYFPSNVGFGGVAALAGDAGATVVNTQRTTLVHMVGIGFQLPIYPVLIEDQQSISATITFPWTTNPTPSDDRAICVVLDGNLLREVS